MNFKIISVLAIIAVVIAGGAMIALSGNDDTTGNISVVDNKGAEIVLDEPLTKVCVINTNIPIAMNILGLQDSVVGTDSVTLSKNGNKTLFLNATDLGKRSAISGESILDSGTKYVITPQSMGITSNLDSIRDMGVELIYLDCYGDTAIEDMEKIVKLFGNKPETVKRFNDYKNLYEGYFALVDSTVKASDIDTKDVHFLQAAVTKEAYYTQNAASSIMMERIGGENAFRYIDPNSTDITCKGKKTQIEERVLEYNESNGVDLILLREGGDYTGLRAYENFCGWSDDLDKLKACTNGKVYTMNTEIMSGYLSYIGYALMAETFGITVDMDYSGIISDFNEKYGSSFGTTGLLTQITNENGTAKAVVLY